MYGPMTENMYRALGQICGGMLYADGRSGDALVRRKYATLRGFQYTPTEKGRDLYTAYAKRKADREKNRLRYPTSDIAFAASAYGMSRSSDFKPTLESYRILAAAANRMGEELAKRINADRKR